MASPWSWFKFDTGAHAHPKIATLSDGAFRVLTRIWALARQSPEPGRVYLKPGQGVPFSFIASSAGARIDAGEALKLVRDQLVSNGLIRIDEKGVIEVNDFEEHNHVAPSKTTEGERERKRSQREKKRASQPDVPTLSQPLSQPQSRKSPETEERREEESREEKSVKEARTLAPENVLAQGHGAQGEPATAAPAHGTPPASETPPSHFPELDEFELEMQRHLPGFALNIRREEAQRYVKLAGVDACLESVVEALQRTGQRANTAFIIGVLRNTMPLNGKQKAAASKPKQAAATSSCEPWEKILAAWPPERADLRDKYLAPMQARVEGTMLVLTSPDRYHADFIRDAGYVATVQKLASDIEWTVRFEARKGAA